MTMMTPERPMWGIEIRGFLVAEDETPLRHDVFFDSFCDFCERQGWHFNGLTVEVDLNAIDDDTDGLST